MKQQPDISFVVVNYNGLADTRELLQSMRSNLSNLFYETIVVDNGSISNESIVLSNEFPEYIHIRNDANLGFAGGNNRGIKQAKGRYIMLLNNDTLLPDSSVSEIIQFMDANPRIGAASPKIHFLKPANTIQYAGFTELSKITLRNSGIGYGEPERDIYATPQPTAFTHGAAMVVSRKALEKAGFMPEIYFLYYEEIEWCYKIRECGFELWYIPYTTIVHKESRSTGENSYIKNYYMTRNRLLLAKRNRKGIIRCLSILYQFFVSSPKKLVTELLHLRFSNVKAIIKGSLDYLRINKELL